MLRIDAAYSCTCRTSYLSVCVCLSVLGTQVRPEKTDELMEIPFGADL